MAGAERPAGVRVGMTGNVRAAQSLGVNDYLVKPILREQLLGAIAKLGTTIRDVLIVDDDPELVELIARMLQSGGDAYRPIKALGGADGLARLKSEPVDLVLLDLVMPELDGMTLLAEMRRSPTLRAVPVIVLSAQNPEVAALPSGLYVELTRGGSAPIAETLSYLEALVAALPLRGLPARAGAPASQ